MDDDGSVAGRHLLNSGVLVDPLFYTPIFGICLHMSLLSLHQSDEKKLGDPVVCFFSRPCNV